MPKPRTIPEGPPEGPSEGERPRRGRWSERFGDLSGEMADSANRRGTKKANEFEDVSDLLLVERPDVTFDDVVGCCAAKSAIREVARAIADPARYLPFGGPELVPRGILLYGEPGVGKTMLAKALANETKRPFVSVNVNDVVTKWFGESEKNVARVFEYARALAETPGEDGGTGSVLFMDEIDALGADRDATPFAGGVTQRIVSVLLTQTSGVRPDGSGHVLVVAATNRIDAIDRAFKRPGRFDLKIEVPLPNPEDRLGLFTHYFEHFERSAGREFIEIDPPAMKRLVERSDGMSPAEIREVVRRNLQREAERYRSGSGEAPHGVGHEGFAKCVEEVLAEQSTRSVKIGF